MLGFVANRVFFGVKLLFSVLEKILFNVKEFVNKVKSKSKDSIDFVLKSILKHEANNKDLVIFIKVLLWIFGIAVAIYFYTFFDAAIKEIPVKNFHQKLDVAKIKNMPINSNKIGVFYYWNSTLYLLTKCNQFNVFLK